MVGRIVIKWGEKMVVLFGFIVDSSVFVFLVFIFEGWLVFFVLILLVGGGIVLFVL